jgi:transcriptional regulator with XRE-family HTH domain
VRGGKDLTPLAWGVFSCTVLRIKELREAHKPWLSQEKLAHKAGLTTKTVRRAELLGRASTETIVALAAALGLEPGDLFAPPKRNGRKRKSA